MTHVIDEPLGESSGLASDWAATHCDDDCAWYHGSWQALRRLGVFQSIRSDDDFFLPTLERLIDGGDRRILVCGAADYALLARLAAVADRHRAELEVTVIDRCRTPLMLNAWYAERAGIDLETVCASALDFRPEKPYDLICTHSFLCFFDDSERERLVDAWYRWLRPGGNVVTAQRVRPQDRHLRIAYSEEEITALVERARGRARTLGPSAGISPESIGGLAEGYGRHHWTWLIRNREELSRPFERAGFEWLHFAPPEDAPAIVDTPGTPQRGGSVRWRIHARKPNHSPGPSRDQ